MPFVLVRIDDRLIHGQVIMGWGHALNPDRIILYSNEIARNPWERELCECSYTDSDVKVCVCSLEQFLQYLQSEEFTKEKIILLVESPKDLLRLLDCGVQISTVNVGGMHFREGKVKLNSYIYVDAEDVEIFHQISKRGVKIEGQDVPTAKKVDVISMIRKMAIFEK